MFVTAFRRRRGAETDDAFPWTVPALRALKELRFDAPGTFLMGENGSIRETIKPVASAARTQSQAAADVAEAASQMSDQLALSEKNVNELRSHAETLSNHVVEFFSDDKDPSPDDAPSRSVYSL